MIRTGMRKFGTSIILVLIGLFSHIKSYGASLCANNIVHGIIHPPCCQHVDRLFASQGGYRMMRYSFAKEPVHYAVLGVAFWHSVMGSIRQ